MSISENIVGKPLNVKKGSFMSGIEYKTECGEENGIGGPAPEAVKNMIGSVKKRINREENRQKDRLDRVMKAKNKLVEAEELL